jgi:hypothetical protein
VERPFGEVAVESIGGENTGVPTSIRQALSVLCYALADETYRKDIYAEEPEERQLIAEQRG